MPEFTETQQRIVTAIERKGAMLPCPRCGGRQWWPDDGYINMFLSNNPGDIMQNSAHRIVTVAVKCINCGYIAFYDQSVLLSE